MSLQGDRLRAWSQSGVRLKALRKAKGISQRTISGLAGISAHTVEMAERGKTNMSVVSALALSNVLECTPEYLLFGTEDATKRQESARPYDLNALQEQRNRLPFLDRR